MQLQDQNFLFFTRTMNVGGTENVILHLCEILKPIVKKIIVCSSGGVYENTLRRMKIKHYTIQDIDNKSLHNIWATCRKLKQIIKNERISVIHTHHRMAAFYCQLIGLYEGIIYINTSHTVFFDKKILTHMAYRHFNLVACGKGVKKSLVEDLGFRKERIKVICNGVKDDESSEVHEISAIQDAKQNKYTVFSMVGRLSGEKGTEYLIRAISLLDISNILCVIVGSGPEDEKLKKLVKDLNLNDRVIFLGFRQDVMNIISQVDFLVLPSVQEGLPLTLIEAFSKGKPVIGTRIDGILEIIEDGKNGVLVPPADVKSLAKAIDYMCAVNRRKMEVDAFKTYKKKYSYEIFRKKYIEYYKQL